MHLYLMDRLEIKVLGIFDNYGDHGRQEIYFS